jgi:glucokinase
VSDTDREPADRAAADRAADARERADREPDDRERADRAAAEGAAVGAVAVGVDIGGSKILTVALGPDHAVLAERRRATPAPADLVDVLVEEVAAAAADPVPVGIGAAGLVDRQGRLWFVPHSRGLEGIELGVELRARTGRRVSVDNDATATAWAESRLGAARGVADALVVTLGTGIGAGLVVDGRIVRGAHGFAGDVGHMVVDPDGPPCPCGGRGHWEVFASGQALDRLARLHGWPSGLAVTEAVLAGVDREGGGAGRAPASVVLEEYAAAVGLGLGGLVDALDPAVVVIGGGVAELGEALLVPLRTATSRATQASVAAGGPGRPEPTIVGAELGARAGAVGAALLAQEPDDARPAPGESRPDPR